MDAHSWLPRRMKKFSGYLIWRWFYKRGREAGLDQRSFFLTDEVTRGDLVESFLGMKRALLLESIY